MQICKDHWSAMKAEIDKLGMSDLIVKTAEEAHAKIVAQLDGGTPQDTFEPALNANFAIIGTFMKAAGVAALGMDGCPLCEVDKSSPGMAQNWIEGACADQKEIWETLKKH